MACTNRPRQLSALARRGCFDLELAAFDAPTVAQRQALLAKLCARLPLAHDVSCSLFSLACCAAATIARLLSQVDVAAISARCVGFVAADVESLCKAALTVAIRRQQQATADIRVQQADFLAAVSS